MTGMRTIRAAALLAVPCVMFCWLTASFVIGSSAAAESQPPRQDGARQSQPPADRDQQRGTPPLPGDTQLPPITPGDRMQGAQEPRPPAGDPLDTTGDLTGLGGNVTLVDALVRLTPGRIEDHPQLQQAYQEIVQMTTRGDFQAAFDRLKTLTEQHDELPPPTLFLAALSFGLGNLNEGLQLLEHTAREHPEFPSTYMAFARFALSQNRLTDALALLEKAERKIGQGNWSEAQHRMFRIEWLDSSADAAIRQGRFQDAREKLTELKQMVPDNPQVHLRMAQVEFDLDNVEASLDHLRQTREHTPDLRMPESIVADWFLQKGEREESQRWIETAAELYPDNGDVKLDYARWLMRNEQLNRAAEAAVEAERLGADQFQLAMLKGQIAFARRSYSVAEGHFERIHQAHPSDSNTMNLLALSLIESTDARRRQKAVELAGMNARMNPQDLSAVSTYAWIQYRAGNLAEADRIFQQVAAAPTMAPVAAFFLGSYFVDQGRPDAARALLKVALDQQDFFLYRARAEELLEQLPESEQNED